MQTQTLEEPGAIAMRRCCRPEREGLRECDGEGRRDVRVGEDADREVKVDTDEREEGASRPLSEGGANKWSSNARGTLEDFLRRRCCT